MRVGITFKFTQYVLPTKRHKKPRWSEMVTCSDVEIREVTEDQFPVALRTHDYMTLVRGAKTYEEVRDKDGSYELVTDDYRLYNGCLYKALRVSYGAAVSDCYAEPGSTFREDMKCTAYRAHKIPSGSEYVSSPGDEPIMLCSDREVIEKAMQDEADNMLFFDGKLWRTAAEPVYEIITFGLGHNHGGTGMFISNGYNPNISAKNYFNALQREEAIAYANKTALNRGDTDDVGRFGDEWIEVLDTKAIKANPQADHSKGGNPMLEMFNSITESADSAAEAGLIAMSYAVAAAASD